jgi:hypothetical protein
VSFFRDDPVSLAPGTGQWSALAETVRAWFVGIGAAFEILDFNSPFNFQSKEHATPPSASPP